MNMLESILNNNVPPSLHESRWNDMHQSLEDLPNQIFLSFNSSLKSIIADQTNLSMKEFKNQYENQLQSIKKNNDNYFSRIR
jgi:hypothetical protein